MKRWLILEDGTLFEGEGFGAEINVYGEIVFTTSMTGVSRNHYGSKFQRSDHHLYLPNGGKLRC